MEPLGQPEVLFCELCNASVPLQDFESGAAARLNGRAIGACCLAAVRGAAAAPAADRPAADKAAAPPATLPRTHDQRLLPVGVAVLGAIAAATLFLDYRIDQADGHWQRALDNQGASLQSQAEVVQGISVALDGAARRADIERLEARLGELASALSRADELRRADAQEAAQQRATLSTALARLQGHAERQPDYGPSLADLRLQLQQQAVTLAQLVAQPRPAPSAPGPMDPAPAAPMPVPGLSPQLAHQVTRLMDPDAATRFEAVDELLRSKEPLVLEHLLPMTKDADTFVRRLTVEGLKDFRKPEVVDALIVALGDPEEFVRETAWRSLKEVTAQKLPFEAGATRDARARAQQKWQEWWDKNRDTFGA